MCWLKSILRRDSVNTRFFISAVLRQRETDCYAAHTGWEAAPLQFRTCEILQLFSREHITPEARPWEKARIVGCFAFCTVSDIFFLNNERDNPDGLSILIHEKRIERPSGLSRS